MIKSFIAVIRSTTKELHTDGTVVERVSEQVDTRNDPGPYALNVTSDNACITTTYHPDGSKTVRKSTSVESEETFPAKVRANGENSDIVAAITTHFHNLPGIRVSAKHVAFDPGMHTGTYSVYRQGRNVQYPSYDASIVSGKASIEPYKDPNPARTAIADVLDALISGLYPSRPCVAQLVPGLQNIKINGVTKV